MADNESGNNQEIPGDVDVPSWWDYFKNEEIPITEDISRDISFGQDLTLVYMAASITIKWGVRINYS